MPWVLTDRLPFLFHAASQYTDQVKGEEKGKGERQRCQLFTLVEDRQTTALPPVQTNDQQVYHGGIADMGVSFLSVCFRNTPHASFFILFSPITVNKRACNVVLRDADGDTYLP